MKQHKIYCIGDSHVSVFLGIDKLAPIYPEHTKSLLPYFEVTRLGPITAYNISEYNRTTQGREKLEETLKRIPDNSWLVFSAGEIDCRVHLIKQAAFQNKSFDEIAGELAIRYIDFLTSITQNKFKLCVLLPPPTSFEVADDSSYPKFGSEFERNKITQALTNKLIEECSKAGIPMLHIFENATSNELETKRIYLWDGVHLATYALPELIHQLRKITGYELDISFLWRIRENLRKTKKLLKSKLI